MLLKYRYGHSEYGETEFDYPGHPGHSDRGHLFEQRHQKAQTEISAAWPVSAKAVYVFRARPAV